MKTNKYISSFDGIRTFALLSVLFYHLIPSVFKGGYLGVVIFFVLAGFLSMEKAISIGKIEEKREQFALKSFGKKLVKLYPALIFMLAIVSIVVFFGFKAQFGHIENTLKGSILSLNNYFQIFSGSSYFENTGSLMPFTHIWALSLEVQAYILFYAFFHGRYEKDRKSKWILILAITSILSYLLSIILLKMGYDYTRVYYGLFTRLYSFSLGALASLLSRKDEELEKSFKDIFFDIIVSICLLLLLIPVFYFEANAFVFYFGFMLYSLISSLVLMILSRNTSTFSTLLSNSFSTFMTKRSYHIYLWHFPIIAIEDRLFANATVSSIVYYLLFFLSCAVMSEISFRLNESINYSKLSKNVSSGLIIVSAIILLFIPYQKIAANTAENIALTEMKEQIIENERLQKDGEEKRVLEKKRKEAINKKKAFLNKKAKKTETEIEEKIAEAKNDPIVALALDHIEKVNKMNDDFLYLDPKEYIKYKDVTGLLLGDSIASMSYHTLYAYMPNFTYDSEHSRQMKDAYRDFRKHMRTDFGDYLILSIGTNGDVFHDDIDEIRDKLTGGQKIIMLSIVLPYKDEEESRNRQIRSYVEDHSDVYLVDWHKAAKERPELFFEDKIHPNEQGARVLGQIIIKKIIEIEKSN